MITAFHLHARARRVNARVPSPPKRIAYVAAMFPKLSETFILREVMELERSGIPLILFSVRPRAHGLVHEDARPYRDRTHYAVWFGFAHVRAFFSLATRHPAGVRSALAFVARDMWAHGRYPAHIAKTLLCLGKMFLFTRQMEREGAVHVHAHFANIATTVAAFAARVLGITYSFTGHAWDIFLPVNQAGLDAKMAGARFVVTCTAFNTGVLARIAKNGVDRAKIVRNHHGVELHRYVPAQHRDERRILAGGRLHPQKGLEYLVEAAALLRGRGIDFRIELIGDGSERARLERAITRHALENHVVLVASMPHEQLVERMRTSAMVVLPCVETPDGFMDGIPNLLIESLALEVPVVSTRLSAIPELVVDGETGMLVPTRDPVALADAIESLIRDPGRGRVLGRNGRLRVGQHFDVRRNVAELAARFREIMGPATGSENGRFDTAER